VSRRVPSRLVVPSSLSRVRELISLQLSHSRDASLGSNLLRRRHLRLGLRGTPEGTRPWRLARVEFDNDDHGGHFNHCILFDWVRPNLLQLSHSKLPPSTHADIHTSFPFVASRRSFFRSVFETSALKDQLSSQQPQKLRRTNRGTGKGQDAPKLFELSDISRMVGIDLRKQAGGGGRRRVEEDRRGEKDDWSV